MRRIKRLCRDNAYISDRIRTGMLRFAGLIETDPPRL